MSAFLFSDFENLFRFSSYSFIKLSDLIVSFVTLIVNSDVYVHLFVETELRFFAHQISF